jgi:hypothetical protein
VLRGLPLHRALKTAGKRCRLVNRCQALNVLVCKLLVDRLLEAEERLAKRQPRADLT